MLEKKKPVGCFCLSNTCTILVYDIDYMKDKVLVGFNDKEPNWLDICHSPELDEDMCESVLGFYVGVLFIPFREVMQV